MRRHGEGAEDEYQRVVQPVTHAAPRRIEWSGSVPRQPACRKKSRQLSRGSACHAASAHDRANICRESCDVRRSTTPRGPFRMIRTRYVLEDVAPCRAGSDSCSQRSWPVRILRFFPRPTSVSPDLPRPSRRHRVSPFDSSR
jgi:hypothetical protein